MQQPLSSAQLVDLDANELEDVMVHALDEDSLVVEDPDDEVTENVVDLPTEGTFAAVSHADRSECLARLRSAKQALAAWKLDQAKELLVEARELDPSNLDVRRMLDDLAAKERRVRRENDSRERVEILSAEVPRKPTAARASVGGRLLKLAAFVACFGAAGAGTWLASSGAGVGDQAAAHQDVAGFTALVQGKDGSWVGTIDEHLGPLEPWERRVRCQQIAEGLSASSPAGVLLTGVDGVVVACGS